MGRLGLAAMLLCVGGCVLDQQERLRAYNEDGVYLYQHGDYGTARQCFDAALVLKPDDPDLLYNLGACYDRQGGTLRAETAYRDCLKKTPNHVDCRHALTVLLVRTKRRDEATTMTADWLAHEPNLAAAYAEDGWLSRDCGDLPRAQARYQQALEHDPHDRRALLELALLYEAMQRPERAIVLYERLLEQDPKQGEVKQRYNAILAAGAKRPRPD